ncbi:hypothetical protein V1498_08580 [Peribacillus sp. SCS-26]|uniref:hypothetical protein n=1 Tax=Paraperibacillus marinus TaxID=3115295 RepID=UPI003906A224
MHWLKLIQNQGRLYHITIFQTPFSGEKKGYRQVYKLKVGGRCHRDVIQKVFSMFNVLDRVPKDFKARYIFTGDILLIDEGQRGKHYYRLQPGGWVEVSSSLVC